MPMSRAERGSSVSALSLFPAFPSSESDLPLSGSVSELIQTLVSSGQHGHSPRPARAAATAGSTEAQDPPTAKPQQLPVAVWLGI